MYKQNEVNAQLDEAQRLRNEILATLPAYQRPGPSIAGTVYVWPTRFCNVGCAHCNFAAPTPTGNRSRLDSFHTINAQKRLVTFVNQLGMWKAVLSGGGEPLLEPKVVEYFIERIQSDHLEEIEIITSGFWGKTLHSAHNVLTRLLAAYHQRHKPERVRFLLRLSVDWFHQRILGLEPIKNILLTLNSNEFKDVHCYIRSVLLVGDSTIKRLAADLNAHVGPLKDYQQILTLPQGKHILVYYKNLILDGRLNHESLNTLPIKPSPAALSATFSERFRNAAGQHIPGRTYNGPVVRHLDGLALIIENDGNVKILEATAPDNIPSLYEHDWSSVRRKFYSDPLTVYLLEDGPEALAEMMRELNPAYAQIAADTNQLYYIVDKMLSLSDARLWATVKVLLLHLQRKRLIFDDQILYEAKRYLEHSHGRAPC